MFKLFLLFALLGQDAGYEAVQNKLLNRTYKLGDREVKLVGGKSANGKVTTKFVALRDTGEIEVVLVEEGIWTHWVLLDANFKQKDYSYIGFCELIPKPEGGARIKCPQQQWISCPPTVDVHYCYVI